MHKQNIPFGDLTNPNNIAINYLRGLAQCGFWGAIRIKFEAGKRVHILREESLIPGRMTEESEKKSNVASSTK
jgi:hypothetical protein